jgi:neutral ceramidase
MIVCRASLLCLTAAVVWPQATNGQAANLRASVVKVDITPSTSKWLAGYPARQSSGVHDHIFHRIVALDDGSSQFFLVSTDICLYAPSVYDEAMAQLKQETGIEPLQVWWTFTHRR